MINIKRTLKTWCGNKSSNQYCYTSTYLEQTQMDIFVDCVVNKFGMEIFMFNGESNPNITFNRDVGGVLIGVFASSACSRSFVRAPIVPNQRLNNWSE